MQRPNDAHRHRPRARSKRSNNEEVDETQLSAAETKHSTKLQGLHSEASPQEERVEDSDSEEVRSRATQSRAGSSASHDSASSSIYDYLDALESECVGRLPLITSRGRATSAPSYRGHQVTRAATWEEAKKLPSTSEFGDTERSPVSSCRSALSHRDESSHLNQYYVGIKEKLATITIELNDKTKTIELLKMARKKDAAKTKQLLAEAEENMKQQLAAQQKKLNEEIEKQMDFAQNLVTEKSVLAKRCDELVAETQKANNTAVRETERFKLKFKDAKERWAAQEKVRRDRWIVKKTEEIKKSTVEALEPDIQIILAKGKSDLEKAREAASDDRRKLQLQLEKERDLALQRLKDDYERKLVDAREKEHAKLMTRLDAADAELQQQLSAQRRRLQEEAEEARNDQNAGVRATKLAHAKEINDLKEEHLQKLQVATERLQQEKQELVTKFENELMVLRGQRNDECEKYKVQLTRKLRDELAREKQELEKQMLESRDAKIEMVIEKLQEEGRQMVECVERKLQAGFSRERAEYDRKLKQTNEIEGVWMEKNRELHEKLSRLERLFEELRRENDVLKQDLRKAEDQNNDLARRIDEERQQHEDSKVQMEERYCSLQNDSEFMQQHQKAEITALREKQTTMESHIQLQVQKLREEHDMALSNLHDRVKATIARKDEDITTLQEELHLVQVKLDKSKSLIEEQRLQLFS